MREQQALALPKSGAEWASILSAYFLEDLLLPQAPG